MLPEKAKVYSELVKLEHTLFALPFALVGGFLAVKGLPPLKKLILIIIAFTGARTGAMSFNRFADAEIDAKNPRTSKRPIQRGEVKRWEALALSIFSYGVLVGSAYLLGDLCFKLSFLAVFILSAYSYTKRFTSLSHFILGLCLSASPLGAWIALRNDINLGIVVLSLGVMFWVAGFDILYSLQDVDFDKKEGLFSIPVVLGVKKSIWLSRLCHAVFFACLVFCHYYFKLGRIFKWGLLFLLAFLIYEHSLVKEDDLSRLNVAFFNINATISVFLFFLVVADYFIR